MQLYYFAEKHANQLNTLADTKMNKNNNILAFTLKLENRDPMLECQML